MPAVDGPVVAAEPTVILEAARRIGRGKLVAFPTETVYGLGGDASNDTAVAAIFSAKGRPRFNPLIVHVLDGAQAAEIASLNNTARMLIEAFWPGPLTLVSQRLSHASVSLLACAGLETVALRAPAHPLARDLLNACGCPLAAPSANRSEALSPTRAEHVAADLSGAVDMILDGGPCSVGIESSIIDTTHTPPVLLRHGGLTVSAISAVIGTVDTLPDAVVRAPGMLKRHYAPSTPLRMNATSTRPGEVLLGFGPDAPGSVLNLSPTGDLREAAANLFTMLRSLDRLAVSGIAVMPVPDEGLGRAINDRLQRASAPPGGGQNWSDDRGSSVPCVSIDTEDNA